jgi:XTP/dITP diphosphohydrolase
VKVLVIASANPHKVAQLQEWMKQVSSEIKVVGTRQFGMAPLVAEDAETFAGNACLKANGIASWIRELSATQANETWVLADDSGLCVDALDGAPGLYSARYAGEGASDGQNNRRLVEELAARGRESSPAHYFCALALRPVAPPIANAELMAFASAAGCRIADECLIVEGRCDGQARIDSRGEGGFGYDPHFWVEDGARTFAEIDSSTKADISHRGRALRKLAEILARLRLART